MKIQIIITLLFSCFSAFCQTTTDYESFEKLVIQKLQDKEYEALTPTLEDGLQEYPEKFFYISGFLMTCYESLQKYDRYLEILEKGVNKGFTYALMPDTKEILKKFNNSKIILDKNQSNRLKKIKSVETNFKSNSSNKPVCVHYIGNSGFMVETKNKTLLFDALFKKNDHCEYPDSTTLHDILFSKNKFKEVDYFFVSHNHPDHIDIALLLEYIKNNKAVKIICPQQVLNSLLKDASADVDLSRIMPVKYDTINVNAIKTEDLNVTAFVGNHYGQRHKSIHNSDYLIDIDGLRIFHTGDSHPDILQQWSATGNFPIKVDIALLHMRYAHFKKSEQINNLINADYHIYMHMTPFVRQMIMTPLLNDLEIYKNPYAFDKQNDFRTIYINSRK